MNTAGEIPSQPLPVLPSAGSRTTFWMRVSGIFAALWQQTSATHTLVEDANARAARPPIANRLPALSVVGMPPRPARPAVSTRMRAVAAAAGGVARRPGLQGRWKSSDRVATLS